MIQLRGIFAAMYTPLDEHGTTINQGRYRAHIDDMIEAGLHGIVLCSGTGEYAYLGANRDRRQAHRRPGADGGANDGDEHVGLHRPGKGGRRCRRERSHGDAPLPGAARRTGRAPAL